MEYYNEMILKDGRSCILKNAEPEDAKDFLSYFELAHSETDFLTTYPDETEHDLIKVSERLNRAKSSLTDVEICAFVDGKLVGSAGNNLFHDRDKTKHRAEFGISIIKEYWGLGIGNELTKICIELAKKAGFLQLELDVVADNTNALTLYQKYGFTEFGRNPRGFRNRQGQWQELVYMRLELDS